MTGELLPLFSIGTSRIDSPTKPRAQLVDSQLSFLPPLYWLALYQVPQRIAGLTRTFWCTLARSTSLTPFSPTSLAMGMSTVMEDSATQSA